MKLPELPLAASKVRSLPKSCVLLIRRKYTKLSASFYRLLLSSDPHDSSLRPTLFYIKLVTSGFIGAIALGSGILFFSEIDEVAIVSGELRPRGSVSEVRTRLSGSIAEILKPDGSVVKKGDVVLQLSSSMLGDKKKQVVSQINQLQNRRITTQAIFGSRIKSLDYEYQSAVDALTLQQTIYDRLKPLQMVGAIQELQILEQRQKVQALKSELRKLEVVRTQLLSEQKKEDQIILGGIAELNQRLLETEELISYQTIISPADGVIFDMKPKRSGDVVVESQLLFKLVPSSLLEASILLTNRDIGLVSLGQMADVRIDAYPYTEYGFIPGSLTSIGKDALPPDEEFRFDRFPSTITLERQYLTKNNKKYILQPGQSVTAKLFLRRKRLATLVTDVIDRAFDALSAVRGTV